MENVWDLWAVVNMMMNLVLYKIVGEVNDYQLL